MPISDPALSVAHDEHELAPSAIQTWRPEWRYFDAPGADPRAGRLLSIALFGRVTIRATFVTVGPFRPRFIAFAGLALYMRPASEHLNAHYTARTRTRHFDRTLMSTDNEVEFTVDAGEFTTTVPHYWDDRETEQIEPMPVLAVRDEDPRRNIEPYSLPEGGIDEHFEWGYGGYLSWSNPPAGASLTLRSATITADVDWRFLHTTGALPQRAIDAILRAEGVEPPPPPHPSLDTILESWERLVPRVRALYDYLRDGVSGGTLLIAQANAIIEQFNSAYAGRYTHALPRIGDGA